MEFTRRYEQLNGRAPSIKLQNSIRVNTAKISANKLIERLSNKGVILEKIPFLNHGYYVKRSKVSVSALPEHLLGYYYIQEAASQIPVELLNITNKDIVLDCCAVSGSKTTQIAEKAKAVIALEPNKNRRIALLNNIERLGLKNIIVCDVDARNFKPEIKFDKILVDAPCSGNYVLGNDWFNKQSIENFNQRAQLQKQILENIFQLLNQGGELIYSTCSLEPEENEMVIDWALHNFNVKIENIKTIGDSGIVNPFGIRLNNEVQKAKRLWPYKTQTQGFFIAKLVKK
ncbi:MAG: RsmB/NOP family class I SAM-dependent RNA methyltransferase [Nanoarchaeota archaeon]|nr:RsmB/NOP family class I SAM-dependent RNA methyltransferase [Nanoarchaeota archaeon]MBU4242516.1 RsmB/NOP family class I SAM-dependent RNA methyltransferase [Nanoarchaeota archaeon]MBU4352450.1 RsmB/NOP family class I SAM-dependent RNA methyltransferase [Nanoarchaeota archaeon]